MYFDFAGKQQNEMIGIGRMPTHGHLTGGNRLPKMEENLKNPALSVIGQPKKDYKPPQTPKKRSQATYRTELSRRKAKIIRDNAPDMKMSYNRGAPERSNKQKQAVADARRQMDAKRKEILQRHGIKDEIFGDSTFGIDSLFFDVSRDP